MASAADDTFRCDKCREGIPLSKTKTTHWWTCKVCSPEGDEYKLCEDCISRGLVCKSRRHNLDCWKSEKRSEPTRYASYDKSPYTEVSSVDQYTCGGADAVQPGDKDLQNYLHSIPQRGKMIRSGLSGSIYKQLMGLVDLSQDEPQTDVEVPLLFDPTPLPDWSSYNFPPFLMESLSNLGFEKPTEVQREFMELLGNRRFNWRVAAEFSSGKTIGMCLAVIKLAFNRRVSRGCFAPKRYPWGTQPDKTPPVALILCPNRENAIQTFKTLETLTHRGPVTVGLMIGGNRVCSRLEAGLDVLVATPGRLVKVHWLGIFSLSRIPLCVLDEVQSLLSPSFEGALQELWDFNIIDSTTSFTFTSSFDGPAFCERAREFTGVGCDKPLLTATYSDTDYVPGQFQRVGMMFRYTEDGVPDFSYIREIIDDDHRAKMLIFANTKAQVETLSYEFRDYKNRLVVRSSDYSQAEPEIALLNCESAEPSIIITTDSFSEGINIPNVTCVIQAYLSRDATGSTLKTPYMRYLGRNGRTGRFGNDGYSISFYNDDDSDLFGQLSRHLVYSGQHTDEDKVRALFENRQSISSHFPDESTPL
ncbi:P-loop containing nucleoside triphosphate hydrolase protein [Phyllosticta capitalensis]|uniref:ATP-dependent RNA helicase n=1 Tax=Phyllosticta capitalensis TaxID=121624 RepID=A0ABR1YUX7_9PEZI